MLRIKTAALQPGMIVASDVRNMDSMLLLPAGSKITERQIGILQSWGVTEVSVHPSPDAMHASGFGPGVSADAICQITSELEDRFWLPDKSNPVYAEVFKLLLQRRLAKMRFQE